METIVVSFEKLKDGVSEEQMAYFNSKAQIIINVGDINSSLQLSQQKITNNIGDWLK